MIHKQKALTGSPGGGSWSIVSGGGSISGTTYTPADVTSTTSVTVRYTMPASGGCPATTSDRTFNVNDASIPGAWFEPCNSGTPTGPFSFCNYNYFPACPSQINHFWYNNTGATITVTLPTTRSVGMGSWTPGNVVVIPPNTSVLIGYQISGLCPSAAEFTSASWSSSDGGFGTVNITF